jgi:hypothetical protein
VSTTLYSPTGGTTQHTVYRHPTTNRCPPPYRVQQEVLHSTQCTDIAQQIGGSGSTSRRTWSARVTLGRVWRRCCSSSRAPPNPPRTPALCTRPATDSCGRPKHCVGQMAVVFNWSGTMDKQLKITAPPPPLQQCAACVVWHTRTPRTPPCRCPGRPPALWALPAARTCPPPSRSCWAPPPPPWACHC